MIYSRNRLYKLSLNALLVVFTIGAISCNGNKPSNSNKSSKPSEDKYTFTVPIVSNEPGGYVDPPNFGTYPSSSTRINSWIANMEHDSIRKHSWDIWTSITTDTKKKGSDLIEPVWETWYSGHELFDMGNKDSQTRKRGRDFEFPSQFFHSQNVSPIPLDPAERVTSFNKFSRSLADTIWTLGFNEKSILDSINASFTTNNTAIADRNIVTSGSDSVDQRSFALKPVFQFISGDKPTAIPYWAGVSIEATRDLTNPEPHTWRQCVVVDPTNTLPVGGTHKMSCNGEVAKEWPVISLDKFYHIVLTKEEADSFSEFGETSGDDVGEGALTDSVSIAEMVKEGNIALLMAMHVTGKETVKWTWQTFWWSHQNQDPIFGKDRPASVKAPWDNYNMRTAYQMVFPAGQKTGGTPLISFNPYLETNLSGTVFLGADSIATNGVLDSLNTQWFGVFSNCMSCHRMAAYPSNQYAPNGFINKADSLFFSGKTKTDFLWSIPSRAK